ncbi:MAG: hypothetical protein ABJA76_12440 [Mucilaginibacter sp.]
MKNSPLLIALLATFFFGCRDDVKKTVNEQQTDTTATAQPSKNTGHNILSFENPVRIANSDYVMYPLAIKSDESGGLITKSSGRNAAQIWNFAFYNTATGEYHLLDNTRKMLIGTDDASTQDDVNIPAGKIVLTDSLIFYSVRVTDFNKDGELTYSDPEYLFASDKNGMNFKQVSPPNLNVTSWQAIKNTGKLLIQAVADVNNDKKFDEDDKVIPYVYDLKTGKLSQVFKENFLNSTGKLFEKHWAEKK